ncbi:hypothetical protein SEEGA711_21233 [Salmonella enterica subsp. enterica serovar Gaminara str. ATCC BAA-711]|nr:hypothetical protein SEEGA711_21233 [Salmonella enterica subsp. enterica serovar Gaminara str. ATCC BAA-711]
MTSLDIVQMHKTVQISMELWGVSQKSVAPFHGGRGTKVITASANK